MSSIAYRFVALLKTVVCRLPVGTNRAVFELLFMMCSGRLLQSRGALFPGLYSLGLSAAEVRRSEASLAYGRWRVDQLIQSLRLAVKEEGLWRPHWHGGYRPVVCDLVGFSRPRLRNNGSVHFNSLAGKSIPAISLGIIADIGSIGRQGSADAHRVALPRAMVRGELPPAREGELPVPLTEKELTRRTLQTAAQELGEEEVLVVDAGFEVRQLQEAGVRHFVVRGARNFTARRAYLPDYNGHGRHRVYGDLVRPLPRLYKGKLIASTPPDRTHQWEVPQDRAQQGDSQALELRAEFWDRLVLPRARPGAPEFHAVALYDPRYHDPLLLLTPDDWTAEGLFGLYPDRWPVEQTPLAAKQMIGAARQFVFGSESKHRLPELSLLAGALLCYAAAAGPVIPTGFWDRQPRRTPGRLRRELARVDFSILLGLVPQLRKKNSPTDHLPKGILAHRRHPAHQPGSLLSHSLLNAA